MVYVLKSTLKNAQSALQHDIEYITAVCQIIPFHYNSNNIVRTWKSASLLNLSPSRDPFSKVLIPRVTDGYTIKTGISVSSYQLQLFAPPARQRRSYIHWCGILLRGVPPLHSLDSLANKPSLWWSPAHDPLLLTF